MLTLSLRIEQVLPLSKGTIAGPVAYYSQSAKIEVLVMVRPDAVYLQNTTLNSRHFSLGLQNLHRHNLTLLHVFYCSLFKKVCISLPVVK